MQALLSSSSLLTHAWSLLTYIRSLLTHMRIAAPIVVGGSARNTDSWDPSSTFVRPGIYIYNILKTNTFTSIRTTTYIRTYVYICTQSNYKYVHRYIYVYVYKPRIYLNPLRTCAIWLICQNFCRNESGGWGQDKGGISEKSRFE
jgi:hypothetical protein